MPSARVERAQLLLRRQRARAAGESLGDVRVSIPSKMHSQCTGFASSLTSQSSWLESNQHPSCSQGTCPATRLQLEEVDHPGYDPGSAALQAAAFTRTASDPTVTRRGYDPREARVKT